MAVSERRLKFLAHRRQRRMRRVRRYAPAIVLAAIAAIVLILILVSSGGRADWMRELMEHGKV